MKGWHFLLGAWVFDLATGVKFLLFNVSVYAVDDAPCSYYVMDVIVD
jgi:hypothetical protein